MLKLGEAQQHSLLEVGDGVLQVLLDGYVVVDRVKPPGHACDRLAMVQALAEW